jgi:hypothetical protein
MSDRGFTENFIQGNWHHLTGTGNRRSKSWLQTAITRRTLQVYLPVTEIWYRFSVLTYLFSTVLLYQHSSPIFSKSFTPLLPACSVHYVLPHQYALPLFGIWLTHVRLISIIVISIAFLSEHPDQMLPDKEATIKPGTYYVDWSDRASSVYIR